MEDANQRENLMEDRPEVQADRPKGLFITFEGGEGAGKTTHIAFLAKSLESQGREVLCLREPGGTAVGEALRDIVLNPAFPEMTAEAELFIYEAARAQIVAQVIKPALERGAVVLCDRFADSSLAYQGYGRGLALERIEAANAFACQGIVPDRTILMVTGGQAEVGLTRATHDRAADRLELAGLDFHERVNAGFAQLALEQHQRMRVVVSSDTKSQTSRLIFDQLIDLFPWMADESICNDAFFAPLDIPKEHSEPESAEGQEPEYCLEGPSQPAVEQPSLSEAQQLFRSEAQQPSQPAVQRQPQPAVQPHNPEAQSHG